MGDDSCFRPMADSAVSPVRQLQPTRDVIGTVLGTIIKKVFLQFVNECAEELDSDRSDKCHQRGVERRRETAYDWRQLIADVAGTLPAAPGRNHIRETADRGAETNHRPDETEHRNGPNQRAQCRIGRVHRA